VRDFKNNSSAVGSVNLPFASVLSLEYRYANDMLLIILFNTALFV